MTDEEMYNLKEGDVVRGRLSGDAYVITSGYNSESGAIGVRTVTVTHAEEWELVAKREPMLVPLTSQN